MRGLSIGAVQQIVGVAVLKLSVGTNTCRGRLNSIVTHEGPPKVMGRQARDRPPKGVMDRLNCEVARAAAIAPPLILLGLGLLPRLSPTAPAIGDRPGAMVGCRRGAC